MKIESDDKVSFVTLNLRESRDDRFPSCHLAIEVRLGIFGEFRGRNDEVWVERAVLERFIEELKQLERTRRGSATLEALSPATLLLQINVIDAAGHVELTVRLRHGHRDQFGVEGELQIEPSDLPGLVRELSDLVSASREA